MDIKVCYPYLRNRKLLIHPTSQHYTLLKRYKLLSSPPTAKTATTVADISQNPIFATSSVTSTPALGWVF